MLCIPLVERRKLRFLDLSLIDPMELRLRLMKVFLVPILVDEILPGDTFNLKMHAFARMATPIFLLWIIYIWSLFLCCSLSFGMG